MVQRILSRHIKMLGKAILFRCYATSDRVHFLGRGSVYVLPSDQRGRALLGAVGVMHPLLTHVWSRFVKILAPDTVLDVGANYGEIALSTTYPANTRIYLFEPNPSLVSLLRRSIASHQNAAGILLVDKLVSDAEREYGFMLNASWTGRSFAVPADDHRARLASTMITRSATVDAVLAGDADKHPRRLVFKIDVEGFEPYVLAGMKRTLEGVDSFIGVVEFCQSNLRRAGSAPEAFLRLLLSLGPVRRLDREHLLTPVHGLSDVGDLTDLVIASDARLFTRMSIPAILRYHPKVEDI